MKSIETFLEKFNCIPFEEKPPILLQAWFKFFAIYYSKPEDPNELFQKLLGDLKELAGYENSQSRDRPIFLNDDEDHSDQNKECFENSSDEIAVSNPNQEKEEPPQDSDIHQLIEECSTEVSEEQKQSMEDTMLELVKICQKKSFFEVKNVVEQPVERGNRSIESLQNFRVIRKSSISLKDTTTPEMKSDVVIKSNAKNLLPIPSECEVTSEDEKFKVYSNPLFDEDEINSDKLDPHCFNVESDFVESLLNRNTFIDSSSKFDFSGELAHVNPEIKESDFDFKEEIRLIENLLYDNSSPRPPEELNAEIADIIVKSIPSLLIPVHDGDSQREEIDIVIETDDVCKTHMKNTINLKFSFTSMNS
uniref:Reverse transcriptase domain-containing protein n=1 Tax=Tanacetum cinerariifolium TaxID=118510 RepID=A0A6L2JP57_TANCI|nr:hypothetical protein [Tanacetum cinerariifolium]